MDEAALIGEFRALAKGAGLRRFDLRDRIGPQLAGLLAIDDDEPSVAIRRKLIDTIQRVSAEMPTAEQLVLRATFGVHPEAELPTLGARVYWLANRLGCATRTAQRRIEHAIRQLARDAIAEARALGDPRDPEVGYHVETLSALLRLDTSGPELYERRRIVVTHDSLDVIVARFSLPRTPDDRTSSQEPSIGAFYGVQVKEVERIGDEHFRFELRPRRRLRRGEVYEYGMTVRLRPDHPLAPHLTLVPLNHSFESCRLTVRFDTQRLPAAVWRVCHAPPRVLDYLQAGPDLLLPDSNGEVRASFDNTRQGLGYGLAWMFAGDQVTS